MAIDIFDLSQGIEQCSRPWLVDDYRGLYYQIYLESYGIIIIQ
jgi:hypothetical protein